MLRRTRMRLSQRALRLGLLAAASNQHTGPVPDLEGTVVVETTFGTLHLHAHDRWVTRHLLDHRSWEPGETALFGAHLRPGMTFVDVGAHVGYYTVMAGRLVGPRGLVAAFEPNPRNFELLLANVWRNGLANVVCFPWAVAAETGFTELHLAGDNTGDHRIYASGESRPTIAVRTVALDDFDALRAPVDVVKVDVQGAEEGAIRGMERLLAGSPDVLVSAEYWPAGLREFGSDERHLLDYYRSLGFDLRVQNPEVPGVEQLSDDEILAACAGDLHTNLILTRPG